MTQNRATIFERVAKLFSWLIIGQLIAVCTIPILTRVYNPETLGVFATYSALILIMTNATTLKLDLGIILETSTRRRIFLSLVIVIISLIIAIIIGTIFILLKLSSLAFGSVPLFYFFIIPIHLIFLAIITVASQNLIKQQKFNKYGMIRFLIIALITPAQILFFPLNEIGLVLGTLIATGLVSILSLFQAFSKNNFRRNTTYLYSSLTKKVIRKHQRFVTFQLPSSFIESISANILIILLTGYADLREIAFLAIIIRIVRLPMNLISSSVGEVLRERFSAYLNNREVLRSLFVKSLLYLSMFSVLFFVTLCFVAEFFIPIVLGDQWIGAHVYLYCLAPMFTLSLVCTPLSRVLLLTNNQHIDFNLQCCLMVALLLFLIGAMYLEKSLILILIGYSILYIVKYSVEIFYSFQSTNRTEVVN